MQDADSAVGTFADCAKLQGALSGDGQGQRFAIWLAKGVGVVKGTEDDGRRQLERELVRYKRGTAAAPGEPGWMW